MSTDDSLERIKKFKDITVYQITGVCNAAIARNIGALMSTGENLFFIDGDMELEISFLEHVFDQNENLKFDCCTGHVIDVLYDQKNQLIGKSPRTFSNSIPTTQEILSTNGGVFIIRKHLWQKIGGMKTKYRRCQDMELTTRLREINVDTIRIPYLIALHHTIDYKDEKRMWQMLWSGSESYSSLLFREHLLDYKLLLYTLRNNYTSFLILISIAIGLISTKILIASLLFYLCILIIRVISNSLKTITTKAKIVYFFERLFYIIIRDLNFWMAFLFFYPMAKKLSYNKVQ